MIMFFFHFIKKTLPIVLCNDCVHARQRHVSLKWCNTYCLSCTSFHNGRQPYASGEFFFASEYFDGYHMCFFCCGFHQIRNTSMLDSVLENERDEGKVGRKKG